MALHPLSLPPSAALLSQIVELLKTLLLQLAQPELLAVNVNTAWVQGVWNQQDAEWVRRFCLGGQEARLRVIAGAPPAVRQALYNEFCAQNNFEVTFTAGGDFRDFKKVVGDDQVLADAVREFFEKCYALLGANKRTGWNGYEFPGGQTISKSVYSSDFRTQPPTLEVCPYCDGNIGTPQLDHYLFKSGFPLLACSPFNLFPTCISCNDVATAKGNRPAITLGKARSMKKWLHPLFRPATAAVKIKLTGTPKDWIPKLQVADRAEQARLCNHTSLIRTLSKRWTDRAAVTFDVLVNKVRREINAVNTIDSLVKVILMDYQATRGKRSFALLDAAVCEAVLDGRPGYLEEFDDPNPPQLV